MYSVCSAIACLGLLKRQLAIEQYSKYDGNQVIYKQAQTETSHSAPSLEVVNADGKELVILANDFRQPIRIGQQVAFDSRKRQRPAC